MKIITELKQRCSLTWSAWKNSKPEKPVIIELTVFQKLNLALSGKYVRHDSAFGPIQDWRGPLTNKNIIYGRGDDRNLCCIRGKPNKPCQDHAHG